MPWTAYDPINVPKLAVIAVGGFMAFGALVSNRKSFLDSKYRLIQILGLSFILDLLLVLLVSGTNTAQEFFGIFGRATGFVAYISLCFLLIAAVVASSNSVVSRFAWVLLGAGGLSIVYGVIQAIGADPLKWVNQYSPVIGFLGNPNFQSSFVALSAVLAVSMLLTPSLKLIFRCGYIAYLMLALYVIKESHSQQGYLVFAGGSAIVFLIWISKSKIKYISIPAVMASLIGLVFVTLGSLNSGPLAGFLYKDSVTYRGDYWRAGWKMTTQHPFFGVGLDSYGDWYRRTRTIMATLRRGPDITSNAAHNVLIDFSANGGIPLAAIYLFMMALVIIAAAKIIRSSKTFNPVLTGLISVWVAYQAQSIISLNQLGLAVWGWIISGLIIGFEINSRSNMNGDLKKSNSKKGRSASKIADTKVVPKTIMGIFIGLIVGLLAGMPPLVASSKFKSALESGNPQIVENAASIQPELCAFRVQTAVFLANNKLEAQAITVLESGKKKFPDCFELWQLMSKIPSATPDQIKEAKSQMKRLDPHNPDLK
jgi:O-antigen ligase